LSNGELLTRAQQNFDVLITCDTNIYHQQKVAAYNIAVIVLRAYDIKYESLSPLMAETLQAIQTIQPGSVVYVYVDEKLKLSDRRKGKGPPGQP
jgi:predicted nuclease of predicted toxin-antitoxin system